MTKKRYNKGMKRIKADVVLKIIIAVSSILLVLGSLALPLLSLR